MNTKLLAVLLSIILLSGSLIACTSGTKIKAQLVSAYDKQSELHSYHFVGSADLHLGSTLKNQKIDPLTASLLSILQESKVTWEGVSSTNPVRLEARFLITPKGASQPLELPLLIKDNKMYFSIPIINQKDEYFTMDLPSGATGSLQQSDVLLGQLMHQLVDGLKSKWFTLDDEHGTTITISFEQKDRLEFVSAALSKLTEIQETLKNSGLLSTEQNNKLQNATSQTVTDYLRPIINSIQLSKPGVLTWTINPQGFIQSTKFDLEYTTGSNSDVHSLHFINQIDEINTTPKFTIEIPTKVKPFEEIISSMNKKP